MEKSIATGNSGFRRKSGWYKNYAEYSFPVWPASLQFVRNRQFTFRTIPITSVLSMFIVTLEMYPPAPRTIPQQNAHPIAYRKMG